jgi:hypothetical protein
MYGGDKSKFEETDRLCPYFRQLCLIDDPEKCPVRGKIVMGAYDQVAKRSALCRHGGERLTSAEYARRFKIVRKKNNG